jgi:hypothetical protein
MVIIHVFAAVSEGASNPERESRHSPTGRNAKPAAIQGNGRPEKRLSKELLTDTEETKLETACNHLRSISDDVEILAVSWAMDFRKQTRSANLRKSD